MKPSVQVRFWGEMKRQDELSDHLAKGIHDLLCAAEKAGGPVTMTCVFRCEMKDMVPCIEVNKLLIEHTK